MKFKPKKISHKEFVEVYSKVPRLCVDLLVKTKDGVLLTKRSIEPSKGKWHIPGGTVLFGETLKDTINRVANEELGVKVKVVKLIGTVEFRPPSPHAHAISVSFLVKPLSKKITGGKQGKEVKFFKKLPPNTIKEQAKFLKEHNLF